MIQSAHSKHVYWIPDGAYIEGQTYDEGWYFFDETGEICTQPFDTEKEALDELEKYAAWLNRVDSGLITL